MTGPLSPEQAIRVDGPWSHSNVSANGARFHAVSAGKGPLVLLLHGFPTYWWTWRHLIPALADNGYTALAIDLRGFGDSDHPPRGYDIPNLCDDIAGVIGSLGAQDATIIGHGLGGLLGWSTAALRPSVVNRLIALSAPHPTRMREALRNDRAQRHASSYLFGFQRPWIPERQLCANNAESIADMLTKWSADPQWPTDEESAMFRAAFQQGNTAHCALEYHRWAVRSIPRPDGRRFAQAVETQPIKVPVLQLHGAVDRTILPRSALGSRTYVDAPYAWRRLPNLGHFIYEENPSVVNDIIVDWLNTTPAWNDPER